MNNKKCRKWLIFPDHDFSKWEDIGIGKETFLKIGSSPILLQERRCNKCNLKQWRTVDAN